MTVTKQTEKTCKVCNLFTTEQLDMDKFHGLFCRVCWNDFCRPRNNERRVTGEYIEFNKHYNRAWKREKYRRDQEAIGKTVKIRATTPTYKACEVKVKDFRPKVEPEKDDNGDFSITLF